MTDNPDPAVAYQLYTQTAPRLMTVDGERQTYFTQQPSQWDPATQRIVRTENHSIYNRDTRTLYQPDGSRCYYLVGGNLDRCEDSYGTYIQMILDSQAGETIFRQHLGGGQTRDVVFGGAPLNWTMTFNGRTWNYTLEEVTEPSGAKWRLGFDHPRGVLTSVTTPWGGRVDYSYYEHRQYHEEVTLPSGEPVYHGYILSGRDSSGPASPPDTGQLCRNSSHSHRSWESVSSIPPGEH